VEEEVALLNDDLSMLRGLEEDVGNFFVICLLFFFSDFCFPLSIFVFSWISSSLTY